ncbi:hypothetical protein DY000_02007432 [Brassica cretica]|uniref:Uncharacterized protein n=1 Tax=Brassica cretica TaxID=69181 RepID=A0ABQ7BW67_BRACR|nr:hypothetical protein DY000_02007432 [Brassica cretica]
MSFDAEPYLIRRSWTTIHVSCLFPKLLIGFVVYVAFIVPCALWSPSSSMPLLKDVIAVEAFYLGIDTFFLVEACYIDIQGLKLVLSDLYRSSVVFSRFMLLASCTTN